MLNLPPDRSGMIHNSDAQSLREFRCILEATFKTNLAQGARLAASNVRGESKRFGTANLLDGNRDSYWATDDHVTTAELTVTFPTSVTFNVVDIREHLPLGQRIETWAQPVHPIQGGSTEGDSMEVYMP